MKQLECVALWLAARDKTPPIQTRWDHLALLCLLVVVVVPIRLWETKLTRHPFVCPLALLSVLFAPLTKKAAGTCLQDCAIRGHHPGSDPGRQERRAGALDKAGGGYQREKPAHVSWLPFHHWG